MRAGEEGWVRDDLGITKLIVVGNVSSAAKNLNLKFHSFALLQ